jgi:hypothetical protein
MKDTQMSGSPENGSNGFTPVNGPPPLSPTSGRNHIDPVLPSSETPRDWPPTAGDPSTGHGPYHLPLLSKKRYSDPEPEVPKASGPTPTNASDHPSPTRQSAESGQAQAAAPRDANWNGSVDESRMAEMLLQESAPRVENGLAETLSRAGPVQENDSSTISNNHHSDEDGMGGLYMTSAGLHVDMKKRKRVRCNHPRASYDQMLTPCRRSLTGLKLAAKHVVGERRSAMKQSRLVSVCSALLYSGV